VFHAKTKHVEIDYYFIREKVCNNDIKVQHVSIVDQITNVFTKGQNAQRFQYLTSKLMVCQNPINSRGVLDCQNLQQKIQEHLHQFFTPSTLLSIQNNPAIGVTFIYLIIFVCLFILLRFVFLLHVLQFHCTTINKMETTWLKYGSQNKDISCIHLFV
jgi:sulfur relay (sulfurtransferase) complex TusBCD TusD component (DsrE family)